MKLQNIYKSAGLVLMLGLLLQVNTAVAQFGSSSDNQQGMGEVDDAVSDGNGNSGIDNSGGYYNSNSSTTTTPVGGSGDVNPNPPGPGGDPGVPIDGGLSVLLAAGAAYGVKRMRKSPTPKGE